LTILKWSRKHSKNGRNRKAIRVGKKNKNKMKKTLTLLAICLSIFISKNLSAQTRSVEYEYTGTIGNNSVKVTFLELEQMYNWLQGYFLYTKYNKKIEFRGEEGVFDGKEKLTESVDGKNTGYFIFYDLDYSKTKITGKWYTMDGSKSYDVVLNKVN